MKDNITIKAFRYLSEVLAAVDNQKDKENDDLISDFCLALERTHYNNVWHTEDYLNYVVKTLSDFLNDDLSYSFFTEKLKTKYNPKKIAVVLNDDDLIANFMDLFYVLMSGNVFYGKLSANNKYFLPAIAEMLKRFDGKFSEKILFTNGILSGFDALILDNDNYNADILTHYLKGRPLYQKQKKNAVAVIVGNENPDDYENLAKDVFTFFGKGNNAVSFLLTPQNFDYESLMKSFSYYSVIKNNARYFNNYEFNKSACLIDGVEFYDNGFLILRPSNNIASPISVIHYKEYSTIKEMMDFIDNNQQSISAVTCKDSFLSDSVAFGCSQKLNYHCFLRDKNEIDFVFNM